MSSFDKSTSFVIHDDIALKTGLTAKWINEGELSVWASKHLTASSTDTPSQYADENGEFNVNHLQMEFIFDNSILRSLLAEANSIFINLQEQMKQGHRPDFINISRTYRSTVRACLQKLKDVLSKDNLSNEERAEYENYITIFYSVECVWHLCEILIIDPTPSQGVVPQLLDWARFHFPSYERKATELLFVEQDYAEHTNEEFMIIVKGLITQGQVEVARTLLRLHSASDTASFQIAEEILKSMPVYNVYGGLSLQKFRSQWQYWVTDTESKLATGCLAVDRELEEIIKLVSGNEGAWLNLARESSCWYEFLAGYLLYTEPGCKYFELGTFADVWLKRWLSVKGYRSVNHMKHLDRVIHKVMENDMHQVLHDLQIMCDNKWFVTHLTDLLYHCDKLEIAGENQKNVATSLRESLLFDFGSMLMARNSLWLIGMDYLEYSSAEGVGAIELLLPRIPIKTEKLALKIINIAKAKGLTEVEREICRIQSIKSLNNKRPGNALEWAIRSHDNIFVTSVADYFLDHYSKTCEMLCPDVLMNVGAKMFISPRLVFLVKYFDFHQYYKNGEIPQAAELLVNLLDSKITPEYFWPSLLADTIPLLESKQPQFSSKETNVILHHLENQFIPFIEKRKNLVKSEKATSLNLLNDCRIENIDDMVMLLRLACARNLARAFIIENTVLS